MTDPLADRSQQPESGLSEANEQDGRQPSPECNSEETFHRAHHRAIRVRAKTKIERDSGNPAGVNLEPSERTLRKAMAGPTASHGSQ